jgi:hypothetical protein
MPYYSKAPPGLEEIELNLNLITISGTWNAPYKFTIQKVCSFGEKFIEFATSTI